LEPGASSRWPIIANASARSRDGARSSSRASSKRRNAASTAATCPCGGERSTANASSAETNASPASARRNASSAAGGSRKTLAIVSCTIRSGTSV
jgi:hypothetical protein